MASPWRLPPAPQQPSPAAAVLPGAPLPAHHGLRRAALATSLAAAGAWRVHTQLSRRRVPTCAACHRLLQQQAAGSQLAQRLSRSFTEQPDARTLHRVRLRQGGACPCACSSGTLQGSAETAAASGAGPDHPVVRPATSADLWPLADLHCASFHPEARLVAPVLRIDRVFALQMGRESDLRDGTGRFQCLVATTAGSAAAAPQAGDSAGSPGSAAGGSSGGSDSSRNDMGRATGSAAHDRSARSSSSAGGGGDSTTRTATDLDKERMDSGMAASSSASATGSHNVPDLRRRLQDPRMAFFEPALRLILPKSMMEGFRRSADEAGLLGGIVIDTLGQHLPTSRRAARVGGRWEKRYDTAYLSNLAVVSWARRRGVARALVAAAESLALEWGCTAIALHADVASEPAQALYRGMGYAPDELEPAWNPIMQGRPGVRLQMLVKQLAPEADEAGC